MTHHESLPFDPDPVPSRPVALSTRRGEGDVARARGNGTTRRSGRARETTTHRDAGRPVASRESRVLSFSFVRLRSRRARSTRETVRAFGRSSTSTSFDRFIHSFEGDGDDDGKRGKRGDVAVVGEIVARDADAREGGERGEGGAWARGGGWIAPERADERETTTGGRGDGTEWVRGGTARARGVCGETSERCARADV